MDDKALKKDLVQWVRNIDDPKLILDLWNFKTKQEFSEELTTKQLEELEKRLERYDAGKMEFSDWETVKESIRKKTNNAV